MKNKLIFKSIYVLGLIILIAIGVFYVQGYSISYLTLNPQEKIEKILKGEESVKGFSNEEVQIYYAENKEEIKTYAFVKKMGVWILDYPVLKNINGFTKGKDHVYYYESYAKEGIYDFLEDPQGERIYAEKIQIFGKDRSVFIIPYKIDKDTTYKFGDDKNIMNENKLFLDGEVIFYKENGEKNKEIATSIREMKENQVELWELIDNTFKSADKSEPIPDGRTYTSESLEDFNRWYLYVDYDKGHYINISKDGTFMDWAENFSYDIELKGQHSETLAIYIRDYRDFDYSPGNLSGPEVYKVTIPERLREYFNEF